MSKKHTIAILLSGCLISTAIPSWAIDSGYEYQVVILQGITAGGRIEKRSSGVHVDTKKTDLLNTLSTEGWEVLSVVGGPVTDHAVYLRRLREK